MATQNVSTPEPWVQRFWEKVDRRGPDECWPWLASVDAFGHGRCRWAGKPERAYRVSYRIANGPISSGLFVRHTCDNAGCVNPAHLILGTIQDNNRDMVQRGRYNPKNPRPIAKARQRFKSGTARRPIEGRLLSSILKDEATGCWVWQKAKMPSGHGFMKLSDGHTRRTERVHRVAYELWVGPIPDGLMVLHSCDNAACINPAHLRVGTHADNMRDMAERGRAASGKRNGNVANPLRGEKIGLSKLTENAVRQIRAGMSAKEAMAKFGVSKATVSKARTGACWQIVEEKASVLPLSGNTKLTYEQVKEIRDSSLSLSALCRIYDICRSTVYRIKRNKTWHGKPT